MVCLDDVVGADVGLEQLPVFDEGGVELGLLRGQVVNDGLVGRHAVVERRGHFLG